MPANTVEATLRSKFEDGIARGIDHTEKTISSAMGNIKSATGTMSAGFEAAWRSVESGLSGFQEHLRQASEQSVNEFSKMSFAAGAATVAIAAGFLKAGKAAIDFVFDLAKEASTALETKLAFESLTAAAGVQAGVFQGQLKRATEGLISDTTLLQNANRVMQAHVPITTEQYVKLTESVFRLAKANGKDGAEAVSLLTDAIIRGNSRGLQAVGIHLAVRDAVSAAAEAMGTHTGKLADDSRLRVFYNELLEKSGRALAELGPEFISIEDALRKTEITWRGFLLAVGQAIGRSEVLQQLFERLSERLYSLGAGREQMDAVTLATNRFFIALLNGVANGAEALAVLSLAWNALSGVIQFVVSGAAVVVTGLFRLFASAFTYLLEILGKLPGHAGQAFRELATETRFYANYMGKAMEEFGKAVLGSFSGFNDTNEKMAALAASARELAGEMEEYSEGIISGKGNTTALGDSARDAAEDAKKLAEQLKKYGEIRRELDSRVAGPERQAFNQLLGDFARIDAEITLQGALWDARRNELRQRAVAAYDKRIEDIGRGRLGEQLQMEEQLRQAQEKTYHDKEYLTQLGAQIDAITGEDRIRREKQYQDVLDKGAKKREEARRKEVQDAIGAANAIERAIELAAKGKLAPEVGQDALGRLPQTIAAMKRQLDELRRKPIIDERQMEDVVKLLAALDKLNRINWTPWQRAMQGMKDALRDFAQRGTEAWANFFADLASGQEKSGKKLLAAFIGMIGQMLVHIGVILVQSGIAEIALAQTLVGRLMGASLAGGLKAIAVGALIAAAGGIMQGLASGMAQTNQAGQGASFQTETPRPTSSGQVQVINVGAPRGPQSPGEASNQIRGEITVRVAPPPGWVASEVVKEVGRNHKQLRLAIQNA